MLSYCLWHSRPLDRKTAPCARGRVSRDGVPWNCVGLRNQVSRNHLGGQSGITQPPRSCGRCGTRTAGKMVASSSPPERATKPRRGGGGNRDNTHGLLRPPRKPPSSLDIPMGLPQQGHDRAPQQQGHNKRLAASRTTATMSAQQGAAAGEAAAKRSKEEAILVLGGERGGGAEDGTAMGRLPSDRKDD